MVCVEKITFFDQNTIRIPLFWLAIGLVIIEVCPGRIYRIKRGPPVMDHQEI